MTSNVELGPQKAYIQSTISSVQSDWGQATASDYPRLTLLRSLLSVVRDSSAIKTLRAEGIEIADIGHQYLIDSARTCIKAFCQAPDDSTPTNSLSRPLLSALVTLDAVEVLDHQTIAETLQFAIQPLVAASDALVAKGLRAGWEIRIFLVKNFGSEMDFPLDVPLSTIFMAETVEDATVTASIPTALRADRAIIVDFIDAAVKNTNEDARLSRLHQILDNVDPGSQSVVPLLTAMELVQHIEGRLTSK